MEKKLHTGVSWFGFAEANDVRAENVEITADGSRFICKTADGSAEFFIPQIGEHNVMNALSAIAVGRYFAGNGTDWESAGTASFWKLYRD